MPTNASGGLITALKNSLADSNDGWAVVSVSDTSSIYHSLTFDEGYSLLTGTRDIRTITLRSSALTIDPAVASPMVVTYISVWDGASFQEGFIVAHGGEWKTTDSALDTTVRALAASFLSARDTALTTALGASASTADVIPSNVLSALNASLAGEEWDVRAVFRIPTAVVPGPGLSEPCIEMTVSLVAQEVTIPAETTLPAQVTYMARLNTLGTLIEARVSISGATWRTKDSTLHTAIMTKANAWLTAQQAEIVAGLT